MNYAVYIKQGVMGMCLEEALPRNIDVIATGNYEECLNFYNKQKCRKFEFCWNPHTNQKQLISNLQYVQSRN